MPTENRSARLQRIKILAQVLTALSLLILLVSAYIRLRGAGLGCGPWPDCYGQILTGTAQLHNGEARILHRGVASLTLVLGFALVWQCRRPQTIQPPAPYATALLVLMIVLTFVGLWSSDPHRAWAGFINILGGAGLVLLSWRTALAAGSAQGAASPRHLVGLLHAGLGLLALTIMLGALIGVRYAATACPSLPDCGGVLWPATSGLSALNPFTTIAVAVPMGDDGGVALHLLHRYCALATLLLLGLGGLQALAQPATRQSAGLLLTLLLTQMALGVLTVLSGFSLRLAVAHSVCASALLAVGMQVLVRAKASA